MITLSVLCVIAEVKNIVSAVLYSSSSTLVIIANIKCNFVDDRSTYICLHRNYINFNKRRVNDTICIVNIKQIFLGDITKLS